MDERIAHSALPISFCVFIKSQTDDCCTNYVYRNKMNGWKTISNIAHTFAFNKHVRTISGYKFDIFIYHRFFTICRQCLRLFSILHTIRNKLLVFVFAQFCQIVTHTAGCIDD